MMKLLPPPHRSLAILLLCGAIPSAVHALPQATTEKPETKTTKAKQRPLVQQDPAKEAIEQLVITTAAPTQPNVVISDPKKARQPLPAHDGADYLKTFAGFAVTRKGGTDGDASFRGMAGSRLGMVVDGETILGGCNARMDAPTAYIYPELHDQMTLIKGPQSVRYGAGHSAATVLFERHNPRFVDAGYRLDASALAASFARHDQLLDARVGNRNGYWRVGGSRSEANDYQDGEGNAIHSSYQRQSEQVTLGLTPSDQTLFEASFAYSNGEAAYADRAMDGSKFLRQSTNLRFEQTELTPWLNQLKLHWFDNQVDHVMDDQQLRQPGMMGYANLKRATHGGSAQVELLLAEDQPLLLGIDHQANQHDSRSAPPSGIYNAWAADATLMQTGFFAEYQYPISGQQQLFTGYRMDRWQAQDLRAMLGSMMQGMTANPSFLQRRKDTLHSGFVRFEQQLSDSPTRYYVGLGQAARFPDYWELIAKAGEQSLSAFDIASETTRQLDIGLLYQANQRQWSVSGFYAELSNYILVDYSNRMKSNGFVRNIAAKTRGAEITYLQKLTPQWQIDAAFSLVHADNQTDLRPLPQQSPAELRLGASYVQQHSSVGLLWRGVRAQQRFDRQRGSIVGQDVGPSQGFGILSLNASWMPVAGVTFAAGIDNLLDRTYAEFISRAGGNGMGGAIPGFEQTTRVNEPGRTAWLKVSYRLDKYF